MEDWQKQTILDLRSWGCNKLADMLIEEFEEEENKRKEVSE